MDELFGIQFCPDWISPPARRADIPVGPTGRGAQTYDEDGLGQTWLWQSLHTLEGIKEVIGELVSSLEEAGYSVKEIFAVRQAVVEAILNAIEHGHGSDPGNAVQVRSLVTPTCALVEVQDEGPGFRPEEVPDPLAPENLGCDRGRGLLLMRAYMTWVRFSDGGRCVTLCKTRS